MDLHPDFNAFAGAEFAEFAEALADVANGGWLIGVGREAVGADLDTPGASVVGEVDEGLGIGDVLGADGEVWRLELGGGAEAEEADFTAGETLFHLFAFGGGEVRLHLMSVLGSELDGFKAGLFEVRDEGVEVPVFTNVVCDSAEQHDPILAACDAVFAGADFADGVDAPALAFEVRPDHDFAEETGGKEHETAEDENRSEDHERAVVGDEVALEIEEFVDEEIGHDGAAGGETEEAEFAEEVHRAGEIGEQEADGDDVEEDLHRAFETVVTGTGAAGHVFDGDFDDAGAVEAGEGGDEAVEFAVEVDVF